MKRNIILSILVMFVAMSCSDKKQEQHDDKQAFQIDSISDRGEQRMQVSTSENDVRLKGKEYHISIKRTPGDSIARVKDKSGDLYVDNEIVLQITRAGGEKVFQKTFTKHSFSSLVEDSFLSKAILEGMVFDKVTDTGIVLATSVCFPQTDLYVPLSVTITPDGRMSVAKEEILDENYKEEDTQ